MSSYYKTPTYLDPP
jgi:hypothetical protein